MTATPDWEIRRGDSLRLLTEIDDNTFDAVVTDPPYSSGGAFRSDRAGATNKKYLDNEASAATRLPEFHGDSRTERGLELWSSLWLAECWRATVPGGAIAMFCDWRSLPTFSDALQAGGWVWRGVGVWMKPTHRSRPTAGGLWNDTEFVLWGSKDARTEGECLPGTWRDIAAPSSASRLHITEKPQEVLRDLVRLAPAGGHVLDPFTGSGSTGVAALAEGRRFTGIELSIDYAEIASRRLATIETVGADVATADPSLFDS